MYPDIDDPNFQYLIAQNLEFRNLDNNDGLYPHQEFVRRFMSPYTPYKSLILYHSLGSGKSLACISVAVDHYLHNKKRCIIVTKGESGTDNFQSQIEMYHGMSESGQKGKWKTSIFTMKHYISMSNQISNMSDDEVTEAFSNSIIVLDEVHNVRYLKKVTENTVYGSIIRIMKMCIGIKIIIATATPMTDNGEQINSLLGICNYGRSDMHSMNGIISYNCAIQNMPYFEYKGTYEYVPEMCVWASDMIEHQRQAYLEEYTNKPPEDIYRKLTHISLFCFEDGTHGKDVTDIKMTTTKVLATITSMSTRQIKQIRYTKYSIDPKFSKCLVGDELRRSSAKYSATIELLEKSDGNVFIFIEEVKGSGLLLLASILEQHGYELYLGDKVDNMRPGKRYTMCVGSHDISPNINDRLEGFNSDLNKRGRYVRVLLGSRVIGESITLKNVRHFYCLTPHWNDSTVEQAIGRVVRSKSHDALDESERKVNIYIHVSVLADNPSNSVDIKKIIKCKEKERDINQVSIRMIESAVDKLCINSDVPILHVDIFAAAYINNHYESIARLISQVVTCPTNIYELSKKIDVHPTVCKEVLCQMIFLNVPISGKFLRAYGDIVFLVNDPSIPYVIVPRTDIPRRPRISNVLLDGHMLVPNTTFPHAITAFRRMHAIQKAAFLEHCIQNNVSDALDQIDTTCAKIEGKIYHLLLYRNMESSYTSSNPVPKKPLGKTRVFDGTWKTVESKSDELEVFNKYRIIVNCILSEADKEVDMYGIISTIDGYMRLRMRDDQNSNTDRRYVKRGKNIKSFSKELLTTLLLTKFGICAQDMSINEIVNIIDKSLIDHRLYVVL